MGRLITNGVSIIVPTFRRADGLEIALKSLITQTAGDRAMEIIVADNDPQASAKPYVRKFAKTSPIKIHYIHVPDAGVSNARNAALDKASGRYLAFLDDDQEAGENWLETLLDISVRFEAALCFVPTIARIPGESPYNDYYYKYFSRFGPKMQEGLLDKFFGCGNSLIDTGLCTLPAPAFDPALNETGGEDDLLFGQLQGQNINIAWSKAAHVYEDIRPHRATIAYVKVRSFAFGQGPVQICADHNPRDIVGICKWMIIGAMQYAYHTPLAIAGSALGLPSTIHHISAAAQGKGKMFWYGKYKPKLYGAAVVENTAF